MIRKLYLLTHEENVDAHNFYEKVGFDHETTLKDHYYKYQNERILKIFQLGKNLYMKVLAILVT